MLQQNQAARPVCARFRTGRPLFRLVNALLVFVLLFGCFAPTAAAAEPVTVRVGIFSLGQFQGRDDTGAACGYNIDYLTELAKKTHWKYEYVDCNNWVTATQMLADGEIDLLAPAQITDALKSQFDYAALYMGTEAAAIYTKTSTDVVYEDFASMNKLTYGCAENSTFAKKFVAEYCADNDMSPTIKYYANTTELQAALEKGEVDAIVTNIMFASDDYKLLGWFSLMPVYYITQKGNAALLDQLDNAMMQLLAEQPDFAAQLEAKYFPVFNDNRFTYSELQYIDSLPTITVGYEVNHFPLSDTDADSGEFVGITRDILDRISEITGIQFNYVALPAADVTYDYLQSQQIYVLSDVEYNDINSSIDQMSLSQPYLSSEKVLVAKDALDFSADSALHIALATGSGTLAQMIQSIYPKFIIDTYATVEECFDAVDSGRADGTMLNRYIADCYLENPKHSALTVIPIQSIADQLSISTMSYDGDNSELQTLLQDDRFISIMDKAIAQLTTEELNSIVITNTSNAHYDYSVFDLLWKYRIPVLIIVLLIVICFLLMLRARNIEVTKNHALAGINTKLGEAVQQAERANVAKSQFLSRMSHEIRTPMNAIVGLTAIARNHEQEPEKIEDYLVKIDSSSRVLLNIINDVLDMSAIESEKLKIANAEFDLKQVLTGISNIYYTQCQNKGIDFSMGIDITDEMVIGDSLRVNQILMNLVSNAYKFTDAGRKIEITATQTEQRENTLFIRFAVSDTGCGMTPDMLARLFQPFEQESATTAQKTGGSGLGLSIAKNLVNMMHGAIDVHSEKGVGTTFTVDIPFGLAGHSSRIDPEKLTHMKALIVDDDPNALNYTSVVMERIGIPYDAASDGQTALSLLQKAHESGHDYDICFIDWKMPQMGGIALTKTIRERYENDPTVIIISAYDLSEVETEAKAAGANLFISKPIFQSNVFNVLVQLTGGIVEGTEEDADDYDFTGCHILLAEDNEMNAEIAAELLDLVNATVDHAEDGKQAVDKFTAASAGTYQLILMDIQMPVMDGYEAARAIRASAHPEAKSIPIFAMTANAFTEDVSNAISAGMNGHIAKPINTKLLYKTIHKVLTDAKS